MIQVIMKTVSAVSLLENLPDVLLADGLADSELQTPNLSARSVNQDSLLLKEFAFELVAKSFLLRILRNVSNAAQSST